MAPGWERYEDLVKQWRGEILQGLDTVPVSGSPGTCVVYGEQSVSILSASKPQNVAMAAGALGTGRVFAIAHNSYVKNHEFTAKPAIQTLLKNVYGWVSQGGYKDEKEILVLNAKTVDFTGKKVLVWHGAKINEKMNEKVKAFVSNGGGLVHAMTPWGYLQLNPGKSMEDMPLIDVLAASGLYYTGHYCSKGDFKVDTSDEANRKEAMQNIKYCLAQSTDSNVLAKSNELLDYVSQHTRKSQVPTQVPATVPGWERFEDLVKQWRGEILQGLDTVPLTGSPGTCVVYGEQSVSILSASKPQNVAMAAGALGTGRVFAIAHNSYVKNNKFSAQPTIQTLLKNVYEWVSKGAYKGEKDILVLNAKTVDFTGKKVLVWHGDKINEAMNEKVKAFVSNGGGLVHAMTPWGYLQLNPGKTMEDMPLIDVLAASGLYYTEHYCSKDSDFKVDTSDEANRKEAMQNIRYNLAQASNADVLAESGEHLCQGLASAPNTVKVQIADQLKALYDCHRNQMTAPCCSKPMKDPIQRCLTLLCDQLCTEGHADMRCVSFVDDFLGACAEGPTVCAERECVAKMKNFHSTGLYARPGAEIEVEVLSDESTLTDGWVLRIGAHTDNNTQKSEWKRLPRLVKRHKLDKSVTKTFSPYGGLIYLDNPAFKKAHAIKVKISGAVEAPRFDATAPDAAAKWLTSRDAPGPWTDLSGRYITFTMPTKSVKHLDDPGPALAVWDRVVEAHCNLRGTDPSDHPHQWVVCDAQPVAGYMHAGYPIVTMMDVADPNAKNSFQLDVEYLLSKGSWGMYHELGHNMQRSWWTFQGTGEVTCNIFTLHAMDVVSGKAPWIHEWLQNQLPKIERTLKKDNPYDDWVTNPGVALGIYAQLQHSFGWDAYKSVFRHYEGLAKDQLPNGNDNQISYWIEQFSKTVGFNLCPLYEFWGFRLADSLPGRLALPPFLPDDEMTQMAPHRVQFLAEAYPNMVRNVGVV